MRAMRAVGFSGYEDLKLADVPKPAVSEGRVLVRITAGESLHSSTLFCPEDIHERGRL
jgi:NADPH:quinone reductase-like Zn-dependent oxidoreductase